MSTTGYFWFSVIIYLCFRKTHLANCTQPTSHLICPLKLRHLTACSLCQPRNTHYRLNHGSDKCRTYSKVATGRIRIIYASSNYMWRHFTLTVCPRWNKMWLKKLNSSLTGSAIILSFHDEIINIKHPEVLRTRAGPHTLAAPNAACSFHLIIDYLIRLAPKCWVGKFKMSELS